MKKIYKLPLLLVALLVTSLSATAHDFEVDGIYYNITDFTALTVKVTYSGSSATAEFNEYSGDIIIPDSVSFDGNIYSVTAIGDYSFYSCTKLTSIKIPNSVTTIKYAAFEGCSGLTSISIPNTVTSIGRFAFEGCIGLTSVTIPNSVTEIGLQAFSRCPQIESIVVEDENTIYDSRDNCNAIIISASNTLIEGCQNTFIPNTIDSISAYAFHRCTRLATITIPNSVIFIDNLSFSHCFNLTSIDVTDGNSVYDSRDNCNAIIEAATNTLIVGCNSTVIPNTVNTIGDWAFSGCFRLDSITIPNSVTSIGEGAFWECIDLPSITIPNSVTTIGREAFWNCNSLTSVKIPNSVTSIGKSAFECCTSLSSIEVEIGNTIYDSRDNCNAIIETATNTLITGCQNSIIPNSVTSIGFGAFSSCSGLTEVTIPNSVTSIGNYAFDGCTGLTSITSLNPEPPICVETSFGSVPTDCILYVPAGTKEAYANDTYWSYFTNIVELPEAGVDNIEAKQAAEVARYDIHGRLLSEPTHGINIVVYSDGTTRKELVK